jgi:hypothetical protein
MRYAHVNTSHLAPTIDKMWAGKKPVPRKRKQA